MKLEALQASESRTADELRRMAEIQTRSIEYTVGAVTSNVAPPTLGPAITINHSDISFDSKCDEEIEIKSPIPCSDDSSCQHDQTTTHQETAPKIVQESSAIDNIGPNTNTWIISDMFLLLFISFWNPLSTGTGFPNFKLFVISSEYIDYWLINPI